MVICNKCKTKECNVLDRGSYFCSDCISILVLNKFKTTISRFRIPRNDTLLINCTFDLCSSFIVYALNMCIKGTGRAKMPLQIHGIYIDSTILDPLFDNGKNSVDYSVLQNYFNFLSQIELFKFDIIKIEDSEQFKGNKDLCIEHFRSIQNINDRYQYLLYFINNMIFSYAKQNNYTFIASGKTQNELSIEMMQRINMNKGFSIPYYLGEYVNENSYGLKVVYPLRDLNQKEVLFYMHYAHIPTTPNPIFFKFSLLSSSSLYLHTFNFITNLQSITTSTVSTLSETIRKLKTDDINTQSVCTICKEFCPLNDPHQETILRDQQQIILSFCPYCYHLYQQYHLTF